jgi:hypothetical protein
VKRLQPKTIRYAKSVYRLVEAHETEVQYQKYGPGKFDSSLDEWVYERSLEGADEELGDADTFGHYSLVRFDAPVQVKSLTSEDQWDFLAAIVEVASSGAVSVKTFDTLAEANQLWQEIETEYQDFVGRQEESA